MLFGLGKSSGADKLAWDKEHGRVEADLHGWPLVKVLQEIATVTGWQVYVEPEADTEISVKFPALSIEEALKRLLGGFNFALVSGTNGLMRLYVFRTSVADATQAIIPGPQPVSSTPTQTNRIADELIVRVKPGTNIDELARLLGAKVVAGIAGRNIYRLKFTDTAAAESARSKLVANPDVESVDNNYAIDRPPQARPVLASSIPPLSLKFNPPGGNDRLVIGLIDTAIQSLGPELDACVLKPISLAGDVKPDPNTPTHATSMAYTILISLQAATGGKTSVQILPVDIYGNNPITTTFDVAHGIAEAINSGARVINLSLGTEADSPTVREIVRQAHEQGIVFYGAAGNAPVTTPFYPAAYPEVTAVTAGDRNRNIASYANRGSFVDVVAPGTSIVHFAGQQFLVSGTSASAAYATGLAAGLAEATGKTPIEADRVLRENFAPNRPQ